MKKILLALLVFPLTLSAQKSNDLPDIPYKDGDYIYEKITIVDSTIKKDKIFVASKSALVELYKNTNNATYQEDKDAGKMMLKATQMVKQTSMLVTYYYDLNYIIDLAIKDGKYRLQLKGIELSPRPGNSMPQRNIDQIKDAAVKGALKKMNRDLLSIIDESMKNNLATIDRKILKNTSSDF